MVLLEDQNKKFLVMIKIIRKKAKKKNKFIFHEILYKINFKILEGNNFFT